MHPGPINRGVEIDPRVADGAAERDPRSGRGRASPCAWRCSSWSSRAGDARERRDGVASAASDAPLGVFDSGLGGLTVVRALREALPDERHRLPRRHGARSVRHAGPGDGHQVRARRARATGRPRREGARHRVQHGERGGARAAARRARHARARRHRAGRARGASRRRARAHRRARDRRDDRVGRVPARGRAASRRAPR